MKRYGWIGLLVLLALAACDSTTREARHMVKRAELLADTLPDSTVRLIDSVLRMPASFSERERMDMALLQAEALFGCRDVACNVSDDICTDTLGDVSRDVSTISPIMDDDFFDDHATLSTSPELERAAAYYAKKKLYAKAAHAALYSGFVQQHYNEKEAAMRSFKDAEQYGKLASDSLSMAQAEYWMGRMFLDNGMEQKALDVLQNANLGFGNSYGDKALVQNTMGVCYMLQGDIDNAETCLRHGVLEADNSHSNKINLKLLNNYAVLYRLQRKYDQAIQCLRQIEGHRVFDGKELLLLNLNLGNVYFDKGKMDSANYYYKKTETIMSTTKTKPETQLAVYDALYKFSTSRNEDSLALLFRERHEDLLYAIMQQRQEQTIYRIQQQYDYENLQNALNKKIILRHRIILVISLLLLLSSVIIMILQLRHKQMREAEAEMRRQIDNLKNDLRESVKTSYLEQELSSRLRLIIAAYRAHKKADDPNKEWSPIVYKLMNGKEKLFDAVLEEMEKVYPSIYTVLRLKYPELNETETRVCLLSFSDLSNSEIAEILEMSKYTIDKNRSKLRDKLHLKPEKMKEQLHKVISH
jgi:tetratricopeptide (TPR) repeat protein